jgi:hypothetical protein
MPTPKCGFGFNCAAMQLQPGLEPLDCPNYRTCGLVLQYTPEEEVELIRVREIERQEAYQRSERIRETIWMSRRSAAVTMLQQRGCPQPLENFSITEILTTLEQQLQTLSTRAADFTTDCYIAPDHCEAHRYNVKRPSGTYTYNKLRTKEAIFEPSTEPNPVKVIHLSHDDDPRNLEGRRGIERRNRLHQAETQLQQAIVALGEAFALLSELEGAVNQDLRASIAETPFT